MEQYRWNNKKEIMTHEILFTYTTEVNYEMERLIILEKEGKLIFLEGHHCFYYEFDESEWEATEFDRHDYDSIIKFLNVSDYCYLRKKALEFLTSYDSNFKRLESEKKWKHLKRLQKHLIRRIK